MQIQIVGIRSNHVDFICRRCTNAFSKLYNEYVECPYCKPIRNCNVTDRTYVDCLRCGQERCKHRIGDEPVKVDGYELKR
jgi:translation initiation factor 2 beta subunit (eIF-2beta)/eIF-5